MSVLTWVGGKFFTKDEIISRFPKHYTYVEVFGGAGHILLSKPKSKVEIYNDINKDVYTFFKVLRDKPEKLIHKIYVTPYSRDFFNEILQMEPKDDVDRAYKFYVINRMAFSGKMVGSSFGYSIIRKHYLGKMERFIPIIERLREVTIENLDFRELFRRYPPREEVLYYCDPPYYGSEDQYVCTFSKEDHLSLFEILSKIDNAYWALSYNEHEFILDLYKDFYITRIHRKDNLLLVKGEECPDKVDLLITNYEPDMQLKLF